MSKFVCVTMDIEPDIGSHDPEIELLGDPDKLRTVARLFTDREIPVTGFVVTRLLEEAPGLIDAARQSLPIRFEVHSHSHNQAEPDSEREIDLTLEAYTRFFGRPPRGYRAPNGLITPAGLKRLAEKGFQYDSSVFPSYRFDEYGYNNLRCPVEPYLYRTPKPILELPLGVVKSVRLATSLSYLKLLGLPTYRGFIRLFGLPDILVFLCHPYDFFIETHLHKIQGWKRTAHGRNCGRELRLFEYFVDLLLRRGYRFLYIDELLPKLDYSSLSTLSISTAVEPVP